MNSCGATGPVYARYIIYNTLYENEDYYFQIDSHTTFEKNWDEKLLNMKKRFNIMNDGKDFVISHYPMENNEMSDRISVLDKYYIENSKYKLKGEIVDKKTNTKQKFASANMLFMSKQVINDVAINDPWHFLFHGEEFLYSLRLHTHGYNIYAPDENIIYHNYYRKDQPKIWTDFKQKYKIKNEKASLKLRNIIQFGNSKKMFGRQKTKESFFKEI